MTTFSGVGIVRRRGKRVANFADGTFTTDNPATIAQLEALGFPKVMTVNEFLSTVEETGIETTIPAPKKDKKGARRHANSRT